MKPSQYLKVPFGIIIVSCFFFPFVLKALPMTNSKMMLAVVGLIIFIVRMVKRQNAYVEGDFIAISIWAIAVSLVAGISVMINSTPDTVFVSYFMSVWVWLGAAYAAIHTIKNIHGNVTVQLVVNYLLAVCTIQCISALIFNFSSGASGWFDNTFGGDSFMGDIDDDDRLHGIGCALDVAGFRFAAVICMAAYMIYYNNIHKKSGWIDIIYLVAISFITVIGNMISRSTIFGTALAFSFLFCIVLFRRGNLSLLPKLLFVLIIGLIIVVDLYNSNESFHDQIKFGFEGFFSLVETGEWHTNSNEILKNMVVWPDNLKTWLIGDGYINNPEDKNLPTFDPYYIGPSFHGFYMGTDIGYLRYIFYFGVIGLAILFTFFVKLCAICINRFPAFKWMFIMVLLLNFIQWFKVSSDLFAVFAPFLCFTINSKLNEAETSTVQRQIP